MKRGFTPLEKRDDKCSKEVKDNKGVKGSNKMKECSRKRQRRFLSLTGFTLLELLIGITIFAIIAASVYTSLFLGIKVWKQEESRDEVMYESVIIFKELSKRLRCAFMNSRNEEIKFIATAEQLDFFSVNPEGDLENLVFYLESGKEIDSFSLYQSRKKYAQSDEENEPQVELISTKIRSFKLSYFDGQKKEWYENWEEELILPKQVKIEVDFKTGKQNEDFLRLVKYVNIPVGSKIEFSQAQ